MTTNTMKTLRPGLLVSLKTGVSGGVIYDRKDLDEKRAKDGATVEKWETTKIIDDPDEFNRATKVRGKCRSLISGVCAVSDFGLLCPSSREFDLQRAIEEAKREANEHNATARRSFVSVYVITGRIAADDAEAARAVASEVRSLVESMQEGIKAADPEAIRKAAIAARNLGAMLTDDAQAKVATAIEEARAAARTIVKRVQKAGETAATVIAECDVRALNAARAAFVDLDAAKPVESAPAESAAVDLAPVEMSPPAAKPTTTEIEF
ncbi:MAG TPA: hypothetical protein VLV48_06080 [Thermoanaerobaculia bacterium]|nr:hypothetical protein [Thermoanaerobaculia bacterium]